MTDAEKLAAFATRATYNDLSETARLQLKIRVLDALGCAIGALGSLLAAEIRSHTEEFGGQGCCSPNSSV